MLVTSCLSKSSLMLLVLLAIVAISGCLKGGGEYAQIRIDTIDIAASHIRSSYIDFNITAYIENYGRGTIENTSLLLKAYNSQNNLLEKQIRTPVGKINAGKTVIIAQLLELPRKGGYNIQISLYEGESRKASRSISLSSLESLQPDAKNIGLEISEMDFLVRNTSNRRVEIESDIYFTNEGSDNSSEFDVLVKARERDAQLIADKKWIRLGAITPETTVIRSVNLTVPDKYNYLVEVLIWSEDTVAKRDERAVLLRTETKLAEGEHIESRSIDAGGFKTTAEAAPSAPATEYRPAPMPTPGFEIFMALAMMAAALVLRRRWL